MKEIGETQDELDQPCAKLNIGCFEKDELSAESVSSLQRGGLARR